MEQADSPILLRYRGAEKLTSEMTKEELEQVGISILRRAKEKAFFKGRPLFSVKKGK